ncbi:MAG: hypothetical protein K6F77_04255, partial [Lachnospiraceae bacterium]|nr:hypothetical protein [Lachnospiraceae bacterium]
VPLFVFMVLGYPYYWRCKYFHGNNIGPLFMAHNEDDLKILFVINYFMDKFINDYLPKIFDEDYWNEEKYEKSLNYVKELEEGIYKRYTKEKIKITNN